MKRIFISAPYTKGDVAQNVKRAMDVANELINMGYAPFCPHLTHFLHINNHQPYETWLDIDNSFLEVCHAVLRLSGESDGADKEVALANRLGIPVYYSIDEVQIMAA